MTTKLQEPSRVNEPQQATGYAEMISKVAAEGKALVVCRDGAEIAAIVPMEFLELLQDALARERALEISRNLDWDRLVKENPPPQSWLDGDEPKPF